MTEHSCSEKVGDKKGKRAAFTKEHEMKVIDFLKDNKLLYNKCLMEHKDPTNGRHYGTQRE